jgi:hypothetical protein
MFKNVLPLLADWANGIFAVLLVSYWFGVDPLWWYFLIGIVLSMSPDIDAIPELLTRGKVAASSEFQRDHRTFLHYPIISIPLGLLAAYGLGFWGALWLVALVLHLINDLYGTGWGIPLLYPFSRRRFKCDPTAWRSAVTTATPLVITYTETELQEVIVRDGNENWVADIYLTMNWISITEYTLFGLAVVAMSISLLY